MFNFKQSNAKKIQLGDRTHGTEKRTFVAREGCQGGPRVNRPRAQGPIRRPAVSLRAPRRACKANRAGHQRIEGRRRTHARRSSGTLLTTGSFWNKSLAIAFLSRECWPWQTAVLWLSCGQNFSPACLPGFFTFPNPQSRRETRAHHAIFRAAAFMSCLTSTQVPRRAPQFLHDYRR